MGALTDGVVHLASREAAEQGGIISGDNPTAYNASDPLRLWVIQVGIIVVFTQLIAAFFRKIRQPRVIAEVIGGVLLGPSVMGRIPNFTFRIFPKSSIPIFTLTANVGLVFFLFLVGLEIDLRVIRRNARSAFLISAVGLIIPLAMGAVLALPLYDQFVDESVKKGYFILFVAVAIGITAFPVLCRILSELRLLETTVGVVTLSAGVGNDIVGWILLALAVALVNASTGLTALYVLLSALAYILVLMFPIRMAYRWLARRTGSLESGQPTTLVMAVTLLLVLVSALFTDIIGIHAIFGGFLAGLIIPHENGFAIAIVEKLEDIISLIFLPLYFVLSGLNTNLGLLNNGVTWGYTILICVFAFVGKFSGCFVTAKLCGFTFRESGAIGTLMSCKGLVELIVLNVGLSAGILDERTFSMFVLHAIVLTFMTTPLTLLWYPSRLHVRSTDIKSSELDVPVLEGTSTLPGSSDDSMKHKFSLILNRVEHLPAAMVLAQLLQRPSRGTTAFHPLTLTGTEGSSEKEKEAISSPPPAYSPVSVSALRLIELTERTSAVLKSQEANALVTADPLLAVFRTFGNLNRVPVSSALSVIPEEEFAERVVSFAEEQRSQMVIVPWSYSGGGNIKDGSAAVHPDSMSPIMSALHNPFDSLFGGANNNKAAQTAGASGSSVLSFQYSNFIRKVFLSSPADVALFVDRGHHLEGLNTSNFTSGEYHIFLPFFGGPDDRLALNFVMQLCTNPAISATVVRVRKVDGGDEGLSRPTTVDQEKIIAAAANFTISGTAVGADTIYARDTQTQLASDTADNISWARYSSPASQSLPDVFQEALNRIHFRELDSSAPLHAILEHSLPASLGEVTRGKSVIVLVGRGRRLANESHKQELKTILVEHGFTGAGAELSKTLGDVGAAFVAGTKHTNLLVVQAAVSKDESRV
ncbi:cation/H+ exchanger [Schizopora paradoxa]|uniref:Cation/H+ exchanger n=1 Tax=Schizopora paradoxa TaxID=27342 RepID=A0A0H2SE18_9AGAM|nr:cation/H+ exchanger [Schizopora paradoxa]